METKSIVTKDNQKIIYDHYKNGHPNLIVIAHGFFNSKDSILLKELALDLSADYDVIALDFRGHGKSSGLYYWSAKEAQDLLGVLNKDKKDTSYSKIGVIGFSLGATACLIAAHKDTLMDSLIAVSPVSEFRKVDYQFWKLCLYPGSQN